MMQPLTKFNRDQSGAAIVEFALLLPSLILFLALSIEGSRTFWSYQTTISGVRDANRYLARVVSTDICLTGGSVDGWEEKLTEIVREAQSGQSLFPSSIAVTSVTPSLTCVAGDYRLPVVPVTEVSASLSITYPFKNMFQVVGITLQDITATVADTGRGIGA